MRITVKVGTSTLAHATGRLNIQRMEGLCKVLSDLKNAGHEIILVSSGAIGMGVGKLNLSGRPADMPGKQAAAASLSIVVMLGCFVGFGGAKLRAKYDTVKNRFTTGVAADSGYTLNEELTTRLNTAANIITTASNTLGADSTEVQTAQAALDSFSACLGAVQSDGKIHAPDSLSVYTGGRMHMLYQSNETLGAAIGQLYAKLQEQAADPMKMGAVQGQYSQFNSAQTIISNLHYNDAVQSYQKDVGGFPASVLGKLFGIQEVELFA